MLACMLAYDDATCKRWCPMPFHESDIPNDADGPDDRAEDNCLDKCLNTLGFDDVTCKTTWCPTTDHDKVIRKTSVG